MLSCSKQAELKREFDLNFLTHRAIGNEVEGLAWICDLKIVDLDQDGLLDVLAVEGRLNQVLWIRQVSKNVYEEEIIGDPVAGPAHVEISDFDNDGDMDVMVSSMGIVAPNDNHIGAVVILENDGKQNFSNRVLLKDTYRVTYVEAGDLDGDGDNDLIVGQFGYLEGEVRWMEQTEPWEFVSHSLLGLPGTVHAPLGDIDNDGDLDIMALVSQNWEDIYLFENDGTGNFSSKVIWGSTLKDFGSSGMRLADIDLDGDLDVAYTNGDGFDYTIPGSRPWHGVQWLENLGDTNFEYHRIGNFSGSYSPTVVDIEGDGDMDILAVSGFNDWSKEDAVSLLLLENTGGQIFEPHVLAHQPTHLIVLDSADMDGDGDLEFITGGMYFYPPYNYPSRLTLWEINPVQ